MSAEVLSQEVPAYVEVTPLEHTVEVVNDEPQIYVDGGPTVEVIAGGITIIADPSTVTVVAPDNAVTVSLEDAPTVVEVNERQVEVITACAQGPEGIPGPPTGISTEIEKLEFVGKGIGSTKTQTIIIGDATLAESFGVDDELYLQWVLPAGIDRTVDPQITGSFFPIVSEAGLTVTWQIDFLADVHGTNLDVPSDILYMTDIPLPVTAYETVGGALTIPAGLIAPDDVEAIHIRIKRVASSSDPTRVAIEHIGIEFTTDGKVGEIGDDGPQGPQGLEGPQGPSATAITKTTGGIVMQYHAVIVQNTGAVIHADNTTPDDEVRVIGIALTSAATGVAISVQNSGEITNALWTWSVGSPIYLSTNGTMTQVKPTSGFVLRIGLPSGLDRMVVDIDDIPDVATEAVAGILELATQGEVNAGADVVRAITPATLANAILDGGSF